MNFKKFVMSEVWYIVPTSTPVVEIVKGNSPDSITYDKRVLTNLSMTCDYDAMYNTYQFMLRWTKDNEVKTIGYNFPAEFISKDMHQAKACFERELVKSVSDKYERHAVDAFLDRAFVEKNPLDGWTNVGYTSDTPVGGWMKKNGGPIKPSEIVWKLDNAEIKFFTNDGGPKNDKPLTVAEMKKMFEGVHHDPTMDQFNTNNKYVEQKSKELPGMTAQVVLPCQCAQLNWNLRDAIMHLNDTCKWTREKIADWLDDLHDTGQVNLEFDPWKEEIDDNANAGKD